MTAHNIPVPAPVALGFSEIDQYPQDALDNAAIVIETMGTLLSSLDQRSDVLANDALDGVNMILKAAAAQVKLATYHLNRRLDELTAQDSTYPRFGQGGIPAAARREPDRATA